MLLPRFKKNPVCLAGVDIGTTEVRVTALCYQQDQLCLAGQDQALIPAEKDKIILAVKKSLQCINTQKPTLAFALPDADVIAKTCHLDVTLSETEIWLHVQTAAHQYLSTPEKNLSLDYQVIEDAQPHPNLHTIQWFAAKRQRIIELEKIGAALGLKIAFVETESIALKRFFSQQKIGGIPKDITQPSNKEFMLSLGLALRVKEL